MTEFFDTIDTWEREIQEKEKESDVMIEEVEPITIMEEEEKEPSESFEAIDPSDDGLFQMLNASVRPETATSPMRRAKGHHHHHHHHPNPKANSPHKRSTKTRPTSSSESPDLPLINEEAVRTPKTETRKGKPSSGSRSTSRSHGRHERGERDDLSSSQKSSGSGSVSKNHRTSTGTTSSSFGRSKSQPRERGATSRHHQTHRKERNRLTTEGDRHRSSSLGRKAHRQSDHGQNRLNRSYKSSTSTASSLSSSVQDDTSQTTRMPPEPPLAADASPTTDDHSANDDSKDGKEEQRTPTSSKGVVSMISQGIASAARTTRKEAERVVKGAANAVTHPKELVRSVGEAASAVTTGVMNATKTTSTEASSPEVNQEEEEEEQQQQRGNRDKESSRRDSGTSSVSTHHLARHESLHSPKGTDRRHRERSRTGSGDVASPKRPSNPETLVTKSEHLDRNESSGHGSRPTGRMTVRERRHQAAQLRNANKPESQPPKTPTEPRSRTVTSPVPPRKSIDRKQSSQSQSSESKISEASRKNSSEELPHENDDDWLKARLSRQDDIMMFARKKETSERKPLSWNGREQETMSQLSKSPRTSKGEIKLESSHDKNQDQERKTILTAGAKVAKVAIGVTALGAREAINAITNPKKEIEKVVRVSNKAAKKTARAASNPKETVQKMATITQKISLNVVREATEVTKGTLQLGRETVQGTVGYVSGLLYEDDEEKEEAARLKEKSEYDCQKLESRQVGGSLVDRVTRVVETSDEKAKHNSPLPPRSREQRREREYSQSARPGMPAKMPSRLVVDATGKPNNSWET